MGQVIIDSKRDGDKLHVVVRAVDGTPLWDYPFTDPPTRTDLLELGHASKAQGFPIDPVLRVVMQRSKA